MLTKGKGQTMKSEAEFRADVDRRIDAYRSRPLVLVGRTCVACGKMFKIENPGQDACSVRCTRAYVLGKRAKKAGAS